MSLHANTIPQFIKMLRNLERWLERGEAFAKSRSVDPAVLLNARLAVDQFPLLRQIQSACDAAKSAAARLAGEEPPKHPDVEQTLEEIRTRIRTCIAYVESVTPAAFEGAESRRVSLPFFEGKSLAATDYLYEMALPNFYFHLTTAYAILRHNGVELGKTDFLGSLELS